MHYALLTLPLAALPAAYVLTSPSPPPVVRTVPAVVVDSRPATVPDWTPHPGRGHAQVVPDVNGVASAYPADPRPPRSAPRSPARSTPAATQTDALAAGLFTRLDADRSGGIELTEAPAALRAAFARWDANGDGTIDRAEFRSYFRQRADETRAAGMQITAEMSAVVVPEWFAALDPAQTGRVTVERWRAAGRPAEQFQFMDRNGDGVLTAQEVMAFTVAESPQPAATSTASPGAAATDPAVAPTPPARAPQAAAKTPDQLEAHYLSLAVGGRVTVSAPKTNTAHAPPASPPPAPKRSPAPAPSLAFARPAPAPASPAPAAKPAPVPDREYATLPAPLVGQSDYWTLRNAQNVALLDAGGKPNVLFLGDSITDLLATGAGAQAWDLYYTPLGAADFAVGGARTSQVLWQIETGQVAAANPKVVVVLIGTNNLGLGQGPEEVAAGIAKIVEDLRTQLPKARVLLLGVLPRGLSVLDPFRAPIAEVNALIADLDDGEWVTYLDIGGAFLGPDGSVSPAVMPDGVHPSAIGYNLYTVAIWKTLTRLLSAGAP